MGSGSRQDQWLNTLSVDGEPLGVWDTFAGGDVEATETKYKPGGMLPEETLGGSTSVNNVTVTKLLNAETDWATIKSLMIGRVGKAPATVSRQPLDTDGNPFGDPLVYTGKLQQAMPGDNDSNSNSAQVWTCVISTAGLLA